MSYLVVDQTTDGAFPVEFFEFTVPGSTQAWRYCSSDRPESLGVVAYTPEAITRSSVVLRASNVESSMTIQVADTNPLALALFAGLSSRPVQVTVRERHRTDPSLQAATLFIGLVIGVSFEGAMATITCGSRYTLASKRRIPHATFQAGCNWSWGGLGCGVDKADYATVVTVAAADQAGRTLTVAAAGSSTDGFFSGGYAKRAIDGDTRFIEEHIGSDLLLAYGWPDLDVAGESVTLYPGCQKTESYCTDVFNNLPNYLGYSRLPSINPYNRSAFYQATPGETIDPGSSWEVGNGYTLVMGDQTLTVDERSPPRPPQETLECSLRLEKSGFVSLSAGATSTVMSGPSWLVPRDPSDAVLGLFEVRIDTPTHTGAPGFPTNVAGGPYNAWVSVLDLPHFRFQYQLSETVSQTHTTVFTVRVREALTGLVRAQGDVTIAHLVETWGGPGGA